nr:MAG TPA: hypothetical protein [Caudoviricetes sp.]
MNFIDTAHYPKGGVLIIKKLYNVRQNYKVGKPPY